MQGDPEKSLLTIGNLVGNCKVGKYLNFQGGGKEGQGGILQTPDQPLPGFFL